MAADVAVDKYILIVRFGIECKPFSALNIFHHFDWYARCVTGGSVCLSVCIARDEAATNNSIIFINLSMQTSIWVDIILIYRTAIHSILIHNLVRDWKSESSMREPTIIAPRVNMISILTHLIHFNSSLFHLTFHFDVHNIWIENQFREMHPHKDRPDCESDISNQTQQMTMKKKKRSFCLVNVRNTLRFLRQNKKMKSTFYIVCALRQPLIIWFLRLTWMFVICLPSTCRHQPCVARPLKQSRWQ